MTEPGPIRQALVGIQTSWAAMLPTGPRAIRSGTIGRSSEVALPVPAHVLDVRRETTERLAGWATIVADDLDLHTSLDAYDVPAVCGLLLTHADYLAEHPASEDCLEELADSARRCIGIAEPPGAREFVGRCGICEGDLRAYHRGPAVCSDCRAVVDPETIRESVMEAALDRTYTAAEVVSLAHRLWDYPVTHVHVSRWVKRGRLLPVTEHEIPARYRMRDVAALVEEHHRRHAG